uniref:Homing endonuclease LAGLIDADG domain-containing protein n=1 Tax=Ulva sp. TM637 TaxID=2496872 RepID=A0A7R6NFD7_9CHLO|nr:hypothetical protein JXX86_mgp28 [Ulva sp. TM637]AZP40113.1 hypothetical protein [Ulva sp. TM637]
MKKQYNYEQVRLNALQKDILIGTLLGDATIATRAGKPILRIKFEQQIQFKTYIDHLYEVFKDLITSKPAFRKDKKNSKQISSWVATRQFKCFKYYYDLFYPRSDLKKNSLSLFTKKLTLSKKRQKRVPKHISKLLSAKVLAYWFMDDGTHKVTKAGTIVYGLSTQGFNYPDQLLLVSALKKTLDLHATIHKSGPYFKLYIKAVSSQKFYNLIKPFILPCFYYKLGKNQKPE